MQGGLALLFAVMTLFSINPALATEEQLARRIAEQLCFKGRGPTLDLTKEEVKTYKRSDSLLGSYRDSEGFDARSWFQKTREKAVCKVAARSNLTLFFCEDVVLDGDKLTKGPKTLCFPD